MSEGRGKESGGKRGGKPDGKRGGKPGGKRGGKPGGQRRGGKPSGPRRGAKRGGRRGGKRGGKREGGKPEPRKRTQRGERKLAASIVRGVLAGRGAARTHIERAFERSAEDGQELRGGLLTELVYGTLRHAGTLDLLLNACAKKGLRKVEDEILSHLRVAAYQLVFLDNVPAAVAVSEAVGAAGRRDHVRGFVNGVLRQLTRRVTSKTESDTPPFGVPSERRFPGREGGWVVLGDPLLPSAEKDPAAWLSSATSLPRALAAGWIEAHGLDGALAIARAQNSPPPLTLRVNRLRGDAPTLQASLAEEGLAAKPGPVPGSLVLEGALSEGATDSLWAGLATVQDVTAMAVAPFLDPQPGERVLDLCAAPGGKTTHMAELMGDEGRIDALDVDEDRLSKVSQAASRLGLRSIHTHLADPADPRPPGEGGYDRVLADVPCSNTGVLRRRVEVRWRHGLLDRPALLALQARLLDRAVELARPGATVVYSTCSIERDENQGQVAALLERNPKVSLAEERLALPERGGGDGGYAARLRVL